MEKKIHIVFHIRSMEIGGVQKVLLEYLKNLPKDIFEISLITSLYQGELLSEILYWAGQGIFIPKSLDSETSTYLTPRKIIFL